MRPKEISPASSAYTRTLRPKAPALPDVLRNPFRSYWPAPRVIERNEREIASALKRSEALRQAILKKAFTGRLVPQSPSDEPASQLLARLRAERAAAPASKRNPTSSSS